MLKISTIWLLSIGVVTTGIVFAVKPEILSDQYSSWEEKVLEVTKPTSVDMVNNTETYVFEHANLPDKASSISHSMPFVTENDRVILKSLVVDNQDDNKSDYESDGGANGIFLHLKSSKLPANHFYEKNWNNAGIIKNYKQYTDIKVSFSLYSALDISKENKSSGIKMVGLANGLRTNADFLDFPELQSDAFVANKSFPQIPTATKYNEFTLDITKDATGNYVYKNVFSGKNDLDFSKELIVDTTLPKIFSNVDASSRELEDVTFWQNLNHLNKSKVGIFVRPANSLEINEQNTKNWNDYYKGLNSGNEDNLVLGLLPTFLDSPLNEEGVSALIKNVKVELTKPR